jgi:hypothetical protein
MVAGPAWAVDHQNFLQGPYPDGPSVTRDCLNCHAEQAADFVETAHWLWKGPTPHVAGLKKDVELGKRNLMNNF